MRLAIVKGTVTLSQCHASFSAARLKLAAPCSLADLQQQTANGETLVVWDDLGAGVGSLIGVSEGSEAAQPFQPEVKPVDAYNAALIDHIDANYEL
jgi:ethanolamine utilization protein EutN